MHVGLDGASVVVDGHAIEVAASIGFAVSAPLGTAPGRAFDTAFALVDAARYHSKNQGRDCATCVLSLDPALPLDAASLPATRATAADGRAILEIHRAAELVTPA
jgi:predicted signal transduction protein with EAL and GGDEF domain